ncbi:hypothetical protein BDR07DRAFT_1417430 [Suillus spraguei]|nr:hypothetical protein BDR07DRAFT_1417430 [Suillus spraguei]
MATLSTEKIQKATTRLLEEARAEEKLSKLTVRIVRERLEESLDLSPGTLDAKEYKTSIKKTVVDYLDNVSMPLNEADNEESQTKLSKKRKVGADGELDKPRKASKSKAPPGKSKKGKQVLKSSAIVDSEASEISENEAPARKKQAKPPKHKTALELQSENEHDDEHEVKPSSSKASKPKKSISRTAVKEHKSASTVESSGDEADAKRSSKSAVTSPKEEMLSNKKSPSKEKPLSKPKSSTKQNVQRKVDDEFQDGASSFTSSPQQSVVLKHGRHSEPQNDSDMSVVIDEPPKKRRKKQEKDSNKKALTEPKKARKSNAGGSKDDETVSRLKAIVVACGVRKVWKKEFADLDTPSGQIKRLKEILKDLGMTGRLTLEKAKTIKAERELAQELRDVQDFAEAQRRRETRKEKGTSQDEQSGSGSDDDDEDLPVKRKKTAGASILAFLGDQSDDE